MIANQKRTKKEFHEYNDYHDRPFGLKWVTAFAMEELMTNIHTNEEFAVKDNQPFEQMSQEEIDLLLVESFTYSKEVEIQLNSRDGFGRLVDNITGFFLGEVSDDYLIIDNQKIFWEDIRHINIKNQKKWFEVDVFTNDSQKKEVLTTEYVEYIVDDSYQPFFEELD